MEHTTKINIYHNMRFRNVSRKKQLRHTQAELEKTIELCFRSFGSIGEHTFINDFNGHSYTTQEMINYVRYVYNSELEQANKM